jgi:CDP-glucose 4,6-dehydratase
MEMNRSFWKDKTVLVTGHTGFKGSWLCLWLRELGASVVGYALRPPTAPSLFELADVGRGIISMENDIRNYAAVVEAVERYQPDIVFHMAAQPLVRESYEKPLETFETNVMGTAHVLQAVRGMHKRVAIVNVTTDKCYDNRGWTRGYRESDALGGHDPYSSSKACSELVTTAYRKSFFAATQQSDAPMSLASARAGNVIGGGDWARDRLIPDCARAWLNGEIVTIRYPNAVRPWQFVLEPLSGYMLLAEKLYEQGSLYADSWNFGPDDDSAQPVKAVIESLASHWGPQARWRIDSGTHPHEAHYLSLDCSKARTQLGWMPKWGLDKALEETSEWFNAYQREPHAIRDITVRQVHQYMDEV